MRKFVDIICFAGWSICLVLGILAACGVLTVSPISYICAILCLLLHYGERLFMPKNDIKVAYICDEKACNTCHHGDLRFPWYRCDHTLDIKHAANFEELAPGKFIEKE